MSDEGCAMRMRNNKRRRLAMAGLAVGVLAHFNVAWAQIPCSYEVTAIIQAPKCPPFGFPPTLPRGMNDAGWIVGNINSCVIGPDAAFVWTQQRGLEILEMPPGATQSRAIDINNHPDRQIVGTVDITGLGTRAFLSDGEELIIIPPPGGGTFSSVAAINNQRQVVGTTADRTPFSKAYSWKDGKMSLIHPTFGPKSAGLGINDSGTVVGWMGNGIASDSHVFIWDGRTILDIGLAPNTFASWANAVNDVGVVLVRGEFDEGEPTDRINGSFVFEDGTFTDLDTLPGYDVIAGFDLNSNSIVVGIARAVEISDEPDIGFIWHNRVMRNLNDLLPMGSQLHIQRAEGINQSGQITGRALDQNSDVVGFILTPVEGPIGDLDGDCAVGASDLLTLLANWGLCNDCARCPADFNDDCTVGAFDLLVLLSNWG